MTRSPIISLSTFALLATLTAGCKQPLLCENLASCGGEVPSGDWVLDANHGSCSEDLYTPPADPRLIQADLPAARTPIPEPALFDWCQLLVTGPGADIVARPPPFLFVESAPVGTATLHYDSAAGTYRLSTTRSGSYVTNFPPYCMRAFGGMNNASGNVCDQLTAGLKAKVSSKKYRNIACQPDSPDANTSGCDCFFDLTEVQESTGSFGTKGSKKLLHRPGTNFPEEVVYCHQGDRLQLTAADDEYLFDRVGLRTLDMVKTTAINCNDSMQGVGEDGIDCGPGCDVMCSVINCFDMMQGPGEDGIDCGRRCPGKPCMPAP